MTKVIYVPKNQENQDQVFQKSEIPKNQESKVLYVPKKD